MRLLLLAPVTLAVAFAWAAWPSRTVTAFKSAIVNERYEEANEMVRLESWTLPDGRTLPCSFESGPDGVELRCGGGAFHRTTDPARFANGLVPAPVGVADMVVSRRVYAVGTYGQHRPGFEFVVERGTVTLRLR
ncbi:hypothetical protein KOR34_04080 [Posidoniimonas corsicana]|uniref:Uncharacterized protein n=1 Tax=Posidoniimonas corsicana TaxID=1938618 RepID=A0A5C5VCZ0_9BACT|nr:hypothetical protein [Posidoniimonas corsicana]TWT35515.1 hypothetical protein KOR34_04080 [Posidoniimonas corsicana]